MSANPHDALPLIERAGVMVEKVRAIAAGVAQQRGALRAMLHESPFRFLALDQVQRDPGVPVVAVDGAHVVDSEKGITYLLSAARALSDDQMPVHASQEMLIVPNMTSVDSVGKGLMTMQEIMLAVAAAREHPERLVLTDGGRISALVSLNQFYNVMTASDTLTLQSWREGESPIVQAFEREDWLHDFLTLPNIAGLLKLVTTRQVSRYLSAQGAQVPSLDDQGLVNLLIDPGESILVPYDHKDDRGKPMAVMQVTGGEQGFPYAGPLSSYAQSLYDPGDAACLQHLYARPWPFHGVYKIETSKGISKRLFGSLLGWWKEQTLDPSIQEPMLNYLADRFASQAVALSAKAARSMMMHHMEDASFQAISAPYRT